MAIKNFVEEKLNIKTSVNYHSYGNMFVIPYNYYLDIENSDLKNDNTYFPIYEEMLKQAKFPKNILIGNVANSLEYSSEGECSDWLLHDKGIISFAPELGNDSKNSEMFYPDIQDALKILKENILAALYIIQKTGYYLEYKLYNDIQYKQKCRQIYENNDEWRIKYYHNLDYGETCDNSTITEYFSLINFANTGFGDFEVHHGFSLVLDFEALNVENIYVKIHLVKNQISLMYEENIEKEKIDIIKKNQITIPINTVLSARSHFLIEIKFYIQEEFLSNSNFSCKFSTLNYLNITNYNEDISFFNPSFDINIKDYIEFNSSSKIITIEEDILPYTTYDEDDDNRIGLYEIYLGIFILGLVFLSIVYICLKYSKRLKGKIYQEIKMETFCSNLELEKSNRKNISIV